MRVSCIILARGGSKGIPNKNIVDVGGNPLIKYTIDINLFVKNSKILKSIKKKN